jgi:hypothetical protein
MNKFIPTFLFIFLCGFPATAQIGKEDCPAIEVNGPPPAVAAGKPQTFTVSVIGAYDPEKLEIIWEIDKGEIISGQGTQILIVSAPKDEMLTATVTVRTGEDCEMTGSGGRLIIDFSSPQLFDEYGHIPDGDILARTDAFLTVLSDNPDSTGYIIIYGPERQIKMRERRFRGLIRDRSFDTSRIIYVIGGPEDIIRTRIWIVPAGTDPSTLD